MLRRTKKFNPTVEYLKYGQNLVTKLVVTLGYKLTKNHFIGGEF